MDPSNASLEKSALADAQRGLEGRGPRWYFSLWRIILLLSGLASAYSVVVALRTGNMVGGHFGAVVSQDRDPEIFWLLLLTSTGVSFVLIWAALRRRAP